MALQIKGGKAVANRKYKLGDQWSSDFDYDGMLAMLRKALAGQMSIPDMEKLYSSMEDVNYHTENRKLRAKIDEMSGKGSAPSSELQKEGISRNLTTSMQALGIIDGQLSGLLVYIDRIEAAYGKSDAGLQSINAKIVALRKDVAAIENALNKAGVTLLK